MMRKLIPLVLALSGLGAGVGAGIALRPDPKPAEDVHADACPDVGETAVHYEAPEADPHEKKSTDFVELDNQFVIPVIEGQSVGALVVMSLTLEVAAEEKDNVYARIPKLRDGFLRVLLDHANVGGFDGPFTANGSMDRLREALTEVGDRELGGVLSDVLILDINRQDL